jgi:hypothetical protein
MGREDRIVMSIKELRRLHVIQQLLEKKMKQVEAAEVLGLSDRQIRRILKRVGVEGERGLVHRSRGRPSNRATDGKLKSRLLRLYQTQYRDFGPTLAAEKLAERNGVHISDETLRLWLLAAGVTHFKRRPRCHRQWRERKRHVGEMVQMDGSHHDWLEGRGPACVLMGYIDDASNQVFARFYEYEGTIPAMDSFQCYLRCYGIPLSVYLDKHSTYRSWAKATLEEQLAGLKPKSQFERALEELGVKVIHADSPQAKGRIERLFGTFQDRLIKEMRLAGTKTIEEANQFLESYLPLHNRRFAVQPAEQTDLHRPALRRRDLEGILCIKTERTLRNDFTVAHHRKLYQIQDPTRAKKVLIQERLDGTLLMLYQGQPLRYEEITTRPAKVYKTLKTRGTIQRGTKPLPNHPWKRKGYFQNEKKQQEAVN